MELHKHRWHIESIVLLLFLEFFNKYPEKRNCLPLQATSLNPIISYLNLIHENKFQEVC